MKPVKCDLLEIAWVFMMLIPMSAQALTIGNFVATGRAAGEITISDIQDHTYLDVMVEVDGKPADYQLEQVNDYQVIIRIGDKSLAKRESLIEVSVFSDLDSRTRSFAYYNESAASEIVKPHRAKDAYMAMHGPRLIQPIVPVSTYRDDGTGAAEFKDGVLHINITKGQTSVGTAVKHIAEANKLDLLILPGDQSVLNSVLLGPVTKLEDLYLASDKSVRHVYIDRVHRLVRIIGHAAPAQAGKNNSGKQTSDAVNTATIGQLLNEVAAFNDYLALIYPGDAEAILNTTVSRQEIKDINDLAMLIGKHGGLLDIDKTNRLLRARK